MYKAQADEQQPGADAQAGDTSAANDDVEDVDFEEVK